MLSLLTASAAATAGSGTNSSSEYNILKTPKERASLDEGHGFSRAVNALELDGFSRCYGGFCTNWCFEYNILKTSKERASLDEGHAFSRVVSALVLGRLYRLLKNSGFVSGPDFSRAVKD
jgi:hypothetical protein